MADLVRLAIVKKQIDEYIESLGEIGGMRITTRLSINAVKVKVSFDVGLFNMPMTPTGEDPFFELSVTMNEGAPITETFDVRQLATTIYQAIGNAFSNQLQLILRIGELNMQATTKPRLILPGQ